jgi:hypothetical protein
MLGDAREFAQFDDDWVGHDEPVPPVRTAACRSDQRGGPANSSGLRRQFSQNLRLEKAVRPLPRWQLNGGYGRWSVLRARNGMMVWTAPARHLAQ